MSSDNSSVFDNILNENTASRTLAPKAVAIQLIFMTCFSVRRFSFLNRSR